MPSRSSPLHLPKESNKLCILEWMGTVRVPIIYTFWNLETVKLHGCRHSRRFKVPKWSAVDDNMLSKRCGMAMTLIHMMHGCNGLMRHTTRTQTNFIYIWKGRKQRGCIGNDVVVDRKVQNSWPLMTTTCRMDIAGMV